MRCKRNVYNTIMAGYLNILPNLDFTFATKVESRFSSRGVNLISTQVIKTIILRVSLWTLLMWLARADGDWAPII